MNFDPKHPESDSELTKDDLMTTDFVDLKIKLVKIILYEHIIYNVHKDQTNFNSIQLQKKI